MKKMLLLYSLFCSFFVHVVQGMICQKEVHRQIIMQKPSRFYSIVADYFLACNTFDAKEQYCFDHLNNNTLGVCILSSVPNNEDDETVFLPKFKLIGTKKRPVVQWDITQIEQRAHEYFLETSQEPVTQYIVIEKTKTPTGILAEDYEQKDDYQADQQPQAEPPPIIEKRKKTFMKKHPHYFTSIVACSVGLFGAISGWFAREWWSSRH